VAVRVDPLGLEEIDSRLRRFEEKFSTPSEKFVEAFRNGHLRETPEFHEWATLCAAREILTSHPQMGA